MAEIRSAAATRSNGAQGPFNTSTETLLFLATLPGWLIVAKVYGSSWSLWRDCRLLLRTVPLVLKGVRERY